MLASKKFLVDMYHKNIVYNLSCLDCIFVYSRLQNHMYYEIASLLYIQIKIEQM